ncbi:bacteriocin [Flavobacterium collinsii]|jgi:bacteriocin-like protein|nr:bacteriocin [Flavobacterium collinsii]
MKNKETKTSNSEKDIKLKTLKPLSKNQLETIVGGPETSRGTTTEVEH